MDIVLCEILPKMLTRIVSENIVRRGRERTGEGESNKKQNKQVVRRVVINISPERLNREV